MHRFNDGVSYPLDIKDRIRNYIIGFKELGLDPQPVYDHFGVNLCNHSLAA
jgi:hypothetical protein